MKNLFNSPIKSLLTTGNLALGLVIFLTFMLAYLAFYEPPWLSYKMLPFPVMNSPVKAGDTVRLSVIRCNSDSKLHVYAISHMVVNVETNLTYLLPATSAPIAPGCSSSISNINTLPPSLPKGTYKVYGFGEVQGTIRTALVPWESQQFEVVP